MQKFRLTSLLIFCGALFYSAYFYFNADNKPQTAIVKAIKVNTVPVKKMALPETLSLVGNTESIDFVEMSPQVSGQIAKILFTPGTYVKKGTPLIQLDSSMVDSEYNAAKANYQLAKMNLERITTLAKQHLSSTQALDTANADFKEKLSNLEVKQAQKEKMLLKAPFSGVLGTKKVSTIKKCTTEN